MTRSSWFQRYLLPAFAFKAVVIGGGYATGRELVEFFLPSGPQGGLLAMLLATVVWSVVCTLTFLFARMTASEDYKTFFRNLLGRFGFSFEIAYFIFIILILAVFGAAAGAIGEATFSLPPISGSLLLMASICLVVMSGGGAVEKLFKYVSIFLYGVYVVFVILCASKFGDKIVDRLVDPVPIENAWAMGGLTYAGYNIIGAIVILPVARYFTSRKDAVIAGIICGPLAMIPAFLFFICMVAYYPEIGQALLPSDVLLRQLNIPIFHALFQVMIFSALLESGVGLVHAVNERISTSWTLRRGEALPRSVRLLVAIVLLVGSIFLATHFGLIDLIAKGYGALAWVFLGIYVLPLLTVGVWRLIKHRRASGFVVPSSADNFEG